MQKIRTVTLELLRKGPPHNQLLSPLTEYLSLCGNFGSTVVNVPWEHAQFISKARELFYPYDKGAKVLTHLHRRKQVINELAMEVALILGSIPGLAEGITGCTKDENLQLTHLRLVISAAELALLPFELSKNIEGIPGGQENWFSLQTTKPVFMTRQVRNVSPRKIKWPVEPRILFIAASPGGGIPLDNHIQALIKAIQPWIKYSEDKGVKVEEIKKMMTILPQASVEDIEEACSNNEYTHIHILAHGMQDDKDPGKPYGLAMHDIDNPSKIDVVTGTRLAKAICPLSHNLGLAVVTVASCNSGAVSSVVESTGASFAYDLHREGIPLVVASQFPLTFRGSIMMVEEVYGRFLWGEDPFEVLHNLRTKLYALKSNDNHDWASLVVYESLDGSMEKSLLDTRYMQARRAIDAILGPADDFIDKKDEEDKEDKASIKELKLKYTEMFKAVDAIAKKFPDDDFYLAEVLGLQGSAEKRKGGFYSKIGSFEESFDALIESRKYYSKALDRALMSRENNGKLKSSVHWLVTQYLSLSTVVRCEYDMGYWHTAKQSADIDIRVGEDQVVWAHGSLAELYLLLLMVDKDKRPGALSDKKVTELAVNHAKKVKELFGGDLFKVSSTKRQFKRYRDWWWSPKFQNFIDGKTCEKPKGKSKSLHDCVKELLSVFDGHC